MRGDEKRSGLASVFFSRQDSRSSDRATKAGAKSKSVFREYAEAIALALILALFIRAFVVQAFKIPSGSMLPTLQIGDHILVIKSIYGLRMPITNKVIIPVKDPQRGDVIVFEYPVDRSKDFIKRVVAVAGDTVEVRNKRLYVNGRLARDEHAHYENPSMPHFKAEGRNNYGPVKVPENKLFVMGDNRDNSLDSRVWGFVDLRAVRGKAFIIYWSWDSTAKRPRWDRLGDIVR